jgi:signal transduction histidine kinase
VIDGYPTHREDLRQTRRAVMITATGVILAALVIRVGISWSTVPSPGRFAVGLAILLFIIACVTSRVWGHTRAWLWLFPTAVLLPLVAITAETIGAQWLPLNLLVTSAGALAALLVNVRAAILLALLSPLVLIGLWWGRPESVVPLGIGVAGGWVAAVACGVAVITMAWAWQALNARADRLDVAQALRVRHAMAVIEQQERSLAWRTTALRVHESLLNSIRHVLSGGAVDRDGLRSELSHVTAEGFLWEAPAPISTLFTQVPADLRHHPRVRFEIPEEDFNLDPTCLRAVRAAVVEAVRNALHHGQAGDVTVQVMRVDDRAVVTIRDDGIGISDTARPGLGSTAVLAANLDDVDGRWQWQASPDGGLQVTISVPVRIKVSSGHAAGSSTATRFNAGRILITSPLAGAVVGGLLYMPYLAAVPLPTGWIGGPAILALLGMALCLIVAYIAIRWRRIRGWTAIAAMAVPVALPYLARTMDPGCSSVDVLAASVNSAGLAVVVLAAWSRWPIGVIGLAGWGLGAFLLYMSVPLSCGQPLHLALVNVLFVFPMMMLGTTVGARSLARARQRDEEIADLEMRALARVGASREISGRLQQAVDAAVLQMRDIADGASLDERARRTLECADARIRIEIQVDPGSGSGVGAFSRLARELVTTCCQQQVPVEVRAVQSSADPRDLDGDLVARLHRVLANSAGRASIYVMSDGEEDHLTIVTPLSSLPAAGLSPGQITTCGDATLWIEQQSRDPGDRISMMLSRGVRMLDNADQGIALAASRSD